MKFLRLPLLLLVVVSGCATPERVARLIVTAPNLQNPPLAEKEMAKLMTLLGQGRNPFLLLSVPVGPPPAMLKAAELPPADYHVSFVSKLELLPNGKKYFSIRAIPATNVTVTPVNERGAVILLHGYGTQKETMIPWALPLAKAGYRVILVDIRGHGQSTGPIFSCGEYEAADMVQLLDFLVAQHVCDGKVGVLGVSFGADLALQWAARDPRVQTVVAIAAYNRPEDALSRFAREMKVSIPPLVMTKALDLVSAKLDLNWTDLSGVTAVRQLHRPVLLISGGRDTISPASDTAMLTRSLPAGSKTIVIPEANHFVIGYWLHELEQPVVAWFQGHLVER